MCGAVTVDGRQKPWLTPAGQVEHLKSKGVKFRLMSETEAVSYLARNSNYFRLRAYRIGFPKVEEGSRKGQYANLDFKMLVDLSIIDMLLRYEMLPITLDIEHFYKVKLLNSIEEHGEDGYSIVSDFIESYNAPCKGDSADNRIKREVSQAEQSPYLCDLVSRYPRYDYPAWSFIEVITFGTFLYFYKFCGARFTEKSMLDDFYLLQSVKGLRNACAHNNCILNNLVAGSPTHRVQHMVSKAVSAVSGVSSTMRKSRLSNDRLQQIITSLYVHTTVASNGVKDHRAGSLSVFSQRMNKHIDYYEGNYQVISSFDFLSKVIDAWYPVSA